MRIAQSVVAASFLLLCSCEGNEVARAASKLMGTCSSFTSQSETASQPDQDQFRATTDGPLELEVARRIYLPNNATGNSPPVISPDGANYLTYNAIAGLWTNCITSSDDAKNPVERVTLAGFGYADTIPFGWADDSTSILGARQKTTNPSGFALGPMAPVEISVDGQVRDLPKLTHAAGNLDSLLWVGGQGLALALFGAKGGYYQPEVENPAPTIAIVNGREGKVLQSALIPASTKIKGTPAILDIDARLDLDGNIFALMVLPGEADRSRWMVWHQGEQLRATALDVPRKGWMPFAVSPDMKTALIMHNLSATGIVCEIWSRQNCPPPTPAIGTIAELREVNSGRVLWSISGTAKTFQRTLKPAISDDGKLALIALPSEGSTLSVALISMQDGRVIQRLDELPNVIQGLGFRDKDRSVWLSGLNLLATYKLDR